MVQYLGKPWKINEKKIINFLPYYHLDELKASS